MVAAVEAVAAVAAVDVAAAAAVEVRRVRGRPVVVSVPQRARVRHLLLVVPCILAVVLHARHEALPLPSLSRELKVIMNTSKMMP